MVINTSPNVSNFDYSVLFDLSGSAAKITVTDISTYISGGQSKIIGINIKVIDPTNIAFHNTVYPPNVDIHPGLTAITFNLPVFKGAVKLGLYKVYATLIDEDGTQYQWTENGLTYKQAEICLPNALPYAKGNFGGLNLDVDFDCDEGTLDVTDLTPYSYKGFSPTTTVTNIVVTFPADTTGFITTQVVDYLPFTIPFTLTGTYDITGSVIQTYEITDTVSVKVSYIFSNNYDIQCNNSLCSIVCDYNNLIQEIIQCKSTQDLVTKQKQLLVINSLILEAKEFKNCGIKTGDIVQKIKDIGGFKCDCACPQLGVNPTSTGGGFGVTKGTMCGDIDLTIVRVGSNFQLNLSDVHYDLTIDPEIQDWVTVTPIVAECSKTWRLNIDFCAAITALGCGGGGGSGTVTNFSAGNLADLFTTSVATSTTTPVLSFAVNQTPFYFPEINAAGTGYQFVGLLGSNVIAVKAASTVPLPAFTYNNGAAGVGATMTANAPGAFPTINAITINVGDRFLYKDATNPIHNGVYSLTSNAGTWVATRTTDADTTAELDPEVVIATQGTQKGIPFRQVTDSPVIGTDDIVYENNATVGKQFWRLNGNGVASEKWIGTKTSFDLPFRTVKVEQMRLLTTGQLVIGLTTGALAKLHVRGTTSDNSASSFYAENLGATHSLQYRNDGVILRDGSLYSIFDNANANTTWGKNAGNVFAGATNVTIFGHTAGSLITSAASVSLFGSNSGIALTTGNSNCFFGTSSGLLTTDGSNNIFIGVNTGATNVHGFSLTLVGSGADVLTNSLGQSIGLGQSVSVTASNQFAIGATGANITHHLNYYSGTGIHGTYFRTTTPEGAQAAQQGSICYVNDATTGFIYLKSTGTGNTGWVLVCTAPCGGASVTALTVAAAQALAGGSGFTAGAIYQITDAYSSTAVINIKAYSTSVLEDYGFGTFQNAAMSAPVYAQMWYDLTTDKLLRVYDPVKQNDVSQNADVGGNAIDNFPFDYSAGLLLNNFFAPQSTFSTSSIINAGEFYNNVIYGSITSLTVDGGSCKNNRIYGSLSGLYMTVSFSGNIFYGDLVTNSDMRLDQCYIGAGKTVDLTNIAAGYSQTGKVYDGNVSTFEVSAGDNSNVNPDGSNNLDMTQFSFAGIIKPSSGANDLITFLSYPTDHEWIVAPDVSTSLNVTSAGNIKFNTDGVLSGTSPLVVNGAKGSFAKFGISNMNDPIILSAGIYP